MSKRVLLSLISYVIVLISPFVPYSFISGVILTVINLDIGLLILPLLALVKQIVVIGGATIMKFFGAALVISWFINQATRRRWLFCIDSAVALLGAWIVIIITNWLYFVNDSELLTKILSVGTVREVNGEIMGRLLLVSFVFVLYQYLVSLGRERMQSLLTELAQVTTVGLILTHLATFTQFQGMKDWYGFERIYLVFQDPNDYACITAALISFPALLFLRGRGTWRLVGLLALFVSAIAVLSTLSRNGIISFLVVLGVSVLSYRLKNWRNLHCIVVVASILLLAVLIIGIEPLKARFYTVGLSDPAVVKRFTMWKGGLAAFLKRPLFGFGGTVLADKALNREIIGTKHVLHSSYIAVLFEYGVLGAVLFTLTLGTVGIRFLKLRRKLTPPEKATVFMLFGMLIGGIGLEWLFKELMWIALGMSFAIFSIVNRERINAHVSRCAPRAEPLGALRVKGRRQGESAEGDAR